MLEAPSRLAGRIRLPAILQAGSSSTAYLSSKELCLEEPVEPVEPATRPPLDTLWTCLGNEAVTALHALQDNLILHPALSPKSMRVVILIVTLPSLPFSCNLGLAIPMLIIISSASGFIITMHHVIYSTSYQVFQ